MSFKNLINLYSENRVARKERSAHQTIPFSTEDLSALPVEYRATVNEIYSLDLESGILTPEQSEKYSNFIFNNPALVQRLSRLSEFQSVSLTHITTESILDLELKHTSFIQNWKGDPNSASKHIQPQEVVNIQSVAANFLAKYNKPLAREAPTFLSKYKKSPPRHSIKSSQMSMGNAKSNELEDDNKTPEPRFELALEDEGIDKENQASEVESAEEQSQEGELENQPLPDQNGAAASFIPNLVQPAPLDLGTFLAPNKDIPFREMYNYQKSLRGGEERGGDNPFMLGISTEQVSSDEDPEDEEARAKRTGTIKKRIITTWPKVQKSFFQLKDKIAPKQEAEAGKKIFQSLVESFNDSSAEDMMTADFKDLIYQAIVESPGESMAAFMSSTLSRLTDQDSRIELLEQQNKRLESELVNVNSVLQTILSAVCDSQAASHSSKLIEHLTAKIDRMEISIQKLIKTKIPEMQAKQQWCIPTDQAQTIPYEPRVKTTPCVSRQTTVSPAAAAAPKGKKLTPLEKARAALESKKAVKDRGAVKPVPREVPIPDLSAPPCLESKGLPKIPTASKTSGALVSETQTRSTVGAGLVTPAMDKAVKMGLPIGSYVRNIQNTRNIDINTLRLLGRQLREFHKRGNSYESVSPQLLEAIAAWAKSNPEADPIRNDLSLTSSYEEAFLFLDAIEEVITKC